MNWKATAMAVAVATVTIPARAAGDDPIGRELAALSQRAAEAHEGDELWANAQPGARDLLERARLAFDGGHRRAALYRLSVARQLLEAWRYVAGLGSEARTQQVLFEAEWKRAGELLSGPPKPVATRGSAFHRALAEAASGEVRPYYEASLEYGRATQPSFGLFYIGQAFASRDADAFAASLSAAPEGPLPAVRPLVAEVEALEAALLAVYKPPLSIDQHPRFIAASGTLKQARELDAAGAHYGALLRYLEAVLRSASLRGNPAPIDEPTARARAAEIEPRLAGADHSLARLFVEVALTEAANPGPDGRGKLTAGVIFADLLPRYFAALAPAGSRPAAPEPTVTVTLVRWPYT